MNSLASFLVQKGMRFQDGTLLFDGKTPEELGVPQWRTQVTYVPQSRTQQKGTPSELYYQAQVIMSPWHVNLLAAIWHGCWPTQKGLTSLPCTEVETR